MARIDNDCVVFLVLVSSAVNAESLVLVGSQVTVFLGELESLSHISSSLPLSDNESSTVSGLSKLNREDVASASNPSDSTNSLIEPEDFSVVVLWHSKDNLVLTSSDMLLDSQDSLTSHS